MNSLLRLYQRYRAKKLGIRINALKGIRPGVKLSLESPCRLADLTIDSSDLLNIGAYTYIRSRTEIMHVSYIGRFCSIGRDVLLGLDPRNHPVNQVSSCPQFYQNYQSPTAPLTVGHDVWIGHRATIMAGISIANGAIIGANSVVTKDVPPYAIVAGNPAKLIRYRFSEEMIVKFQDSEWWQYDITALSSIDFGQPDIFLKQIKAINDIADYPLVRIVGGKVSSD